MTLKLPPIKQQIPDILFYNQPKTNNYVAISPKCGYVGNFSLEKRKEMFITHLFVDPKERSKNFGTKILNFVSLLSKKEGLGGRMRVFASLLGDETKNPPHIFYRKYGFKCDDKNTLAEIDKYIANNKQLPPLYKPMYMYKDS